MLDEFDSYLRDYNEVNDKQLQCSSRPFFFPKPHIHLGSICTRFPSSIQYLAIDKGILSAMDPCIPFKVCSIYLYTVM